jgi:ribose transport system permease protein
MEAVGGNPEAAYLSGVNVRLTRAIGFCVVGLGAALAGIILTSQAASYYSESASGLLLPTYAAVFIGASTLKDGQFHVWGSVVGVLFMATLQTALTTLNQPAWLSNVIQGALLIAAILLTRLGRSLRTGT